MKLLHLIASYVAAQSCNEDERIVSGACKKKCNLFNVSCDVKSGFTIAANTTCRDEQYSHLKFDNSNFFVNSASLSDGSTINPAPECIFTNGEITDLGFDKCGGFPFTEEDKHNIHTGYINHRVTVGGTTSSFMDEIKIECQLEHVQLDTDSENNKAVVGLSENDEKTGTGLIASKKLIEDLELKLEVGTTNADGSFKDAITTEKIDVGTQVHVKLGFKPDSPFAFALRDCAAESGTETIEFYDGFCKNAASSVVSLTQRDRTSYNIQVFRVAAATSLTFKCQVSLFPDPSDAPTCPDFSGRKRREVTIYDRLARSTERQGEVVFTIELADETSGSAKTCANFIIPSMFFYALY